jgi:hypothetical protein
LSYDCNGDKGGTAFVDAIGQCAGGNTGRVPEMNPDKYTGNENRLSLNNDFEEVVLYPNPNKGLLNVDYPGESELNLKIVKTDGSVCFEACISESCTLNISHLARGIYSVVIFSEKGSSTQMLVKN